MVRVDSLRNRFFVGGAQIDGKIKRGTMHKWEDDNALRVEYASSQVRQGNRVCGYVLASIAACACDSWNHYCCAGEIIIMMGYSYFIGPSIVFYACPC